MTDPQNHAAGPKTLKMPIGVVVEPPPSQVDTAPTLGLAAQAPAGPPTLDLGRSVGDLHGSKDPVTWAGASLELSNIAEHRPTSSLARDPQGQTWMRWAVGGTALVVLVVAIVAMKGRHADAEPVPVEAAAVEIPEAIEQAPEPTPEPAPVEDPKAKKAKAKKSGATKRDSTLAAGSSAASEASKPAPTSASKPAATTKPASTAKPTSKPAAAPTPAPSKPAEPSKPALAPPDDDAKGGSAELPDISAWDDQDAAVGDRSAE